MPAAKKPTTKKTATKKKVVAKKAVTKKSAAKKSIATKKTVKKTAKTAKPKATLIKTVSGITPPTSSPTPKHSEATIIKVGRGPLMEKAAPEVSAPEPAKQIYTHKKNTAGIPTVKQIGGVSDFSETKPTPRLKIQPQSTRSIAKPPIKKLIEEHYTDTESLGVSEPTDDLTGQVEVSLDDPAPEANPFLDILEDIETQESIADQRNIAREPTMRPGKEADSRFKNLVDDIDGVKSLDTRHYHVPINSRAVKSAGTYFFEFLVILSLILVFVAILIDADLIETSFELPFDVL